MMPPTLISGSAGNRSSALARKRVFWITGMAFIICAMASTAPARSLMCFEYPIVEMANSVTPACVVTTASAP